MKKHELTAKYQARAIELLSVARAWPKTSQVAENLNSAEQQIRKSMLSGMATALSIYSDLYDAIKNEFAEDDYFPYEYVDEQSLNILQKCVEMCMPGTKRARSIAYVLYHAYGEGYIYDDIEEYVDEFYGGLEEAIKDAEREMGGSPYYSYYASEDEFPATIPERPTPNL